MKQIEVLVLSHIISLELVCNIPSQNTIVTPWALCLHFFIFSTISIMVSLRFECLTISIYCLAYNSHLLGWSVFCGRKDTSFSWTQGSFSALHLLGRTLESQALPETDPIQRKKKKFLIDILIFKTNFEHYIQFGLFPQRSN